MSQGTVVVNAPNANPLLVGANQSFVDAVISGWNRPQLWQWGSLTRTIESQGLIDILPIPGKPPLPRAVVPGGSRRGAQLGITSIAVQQQPYEATLQIDHHVRSAAKGLSGVFDAVVAAFGNVADRALPAELAKHLALNNTLANHDGLAFFHASHPIDPTNPAVKNRVTNSATYSNSLGLGGFTASNLITAIQTVLRNAAYEDGEQINPTYFKVIATPGNMFKLIHSIKANPVNFGSGATVADVAANQNPFDVIQQATGVIVEPVIIPQYAANDTDWFLAIDQPFVLANGEWYNLAQMSSPDTYSRIHAGMDIYQVTARLGIAKTLPNMLFKCS